MKIEKWVINIPDNDVYAVIDGEYVRIGDANRITVWDNSVTFTCNLDHKKSCPVYYDYAKRSRRKRKR